MRTCDFRGFSFFMFILFGRDYAKPCGNNIGAFGNNSYCVIIRLLILKKAGEILVDQKIDKQLDDHLQVLNQTFYREMYLFLRTDVLPLNKRLDEWSGHGNSVSLVGWREHPERYGNEIYAISSGLMKRALDRLAEICRAKDSQTIAKQHFRNFSKENQRKVAQALWIWVTKNDPKIKSLVKKKKAEKFETKANNTSQGKSATSKSANSQPAVKSSAKNKQRLKHDQVQLQPENDTHVQLSVRARNFLALNDGNGKYDGTFKDHPLVYPVKNSLHFTEAVSTSRFSTPVGKINRIVLEDPVLGFPAALKSYWARDKVLDPHALELAWSTKHGLGSVSRNTMLIAMSLVATFGVDQDWQGLAAVCHGFYITDYAVKRKKGFNKLAVLGHGNGLVEDFETGDFENIIPYNFVETAFWYYMTKWAYRRIKDHYDQNSAYLQADESSYSTEGQRILATIRKEAGQRQNTALENQLVQLGNAVQTIIEQNEKLRGLTASHYAHDLRNDSVREENGQKIDQGLDENKKLLPSSRDEIRNYLTRDSVQSQYNQLVQQAVPELGKRTREYEQGEFKK